MKRKLAFFPGIWYNTGIMKKTGKFGFMNGEKSSGLGGCRCPSRFRFPLVLALFCVCALSAHAQRTPIDVNLIVDGSASFADVKNGIAAWVSGSLVDQILVQGDRVTVWNAGASAKVVYSGTINGDADKEAVKKSIADFSASGSRADFSGALREAAGKQSGSFSYTVLLSASPDALSSLVSGPQANLLRFSRIEEFSGWRALVIGLNLDSRVRRASAAFFGS